MAEAQAAQPAQPAFELTTGTTIRVGNLDWNVSAEDLEELFGEIGPLKSAELALRPDGKSKGFAFITYRRKADAEMALDKYNGVPLDGKALKITLQQKGGVGSGASSGASAVQVTTGLGGQRTVTVGKGGGRGRGAGRGGGVWLEDDDDDDDDSAPAFGKGRGKGRGKGGKGSAGGKGKGGKGSKGGKGGGKPEPKSQEDLDAELDAYKSAAA